MSAGSAMKVNTAMSALFLSFMHSPMTVPVERERSGCQTHQRNLQDGNEDEDVARHDECRKNRSQSGEQQQNRGAPARGAQDERTIAQNTFFEQPHHDPQSTDRLDQDDRGQNPRQRSPQ